MPAPSRRAGDVGQPGSPRCHGLIAESSADSSTPSPAAETRPLLGQHPELRGEQGVVDQLDPLARTEPGRRAGSDRRSLPAPAGPARQRLDATDEERDVPGRDVVRSAADRCVDHVDAECARAASASAVRGLPVVCTISTAPGGIASSRPAVQADLADLVVGEYTHRDDVGAVGDLGGVRPTGWRRVRATAGLFSSVRPSARDVVTGRDEATHHRCAHASGADETDPGHRRRLLFAQALIAGSP